MAKTPSTRSTANKAQAITRRAHGLESAAKKRALALVALVARRKQRITEDFYDIGEALRELSTPRLYHALGHGTFVELLTAERLMGETQAHKLVAVVTAFTREQALDLKLEKAFAIVTYAAATPERAVPRFVAETARIDGRPLAELSVREINAAAKEVRARAHAEHASPAERTAARKARAWQAALRRRGVHGALVVVKHEHGALWLDARIPAESADGVL